MTIQRINASQRINTSWFGRALAIAVLGVVGSMASGCAIHSQAPIKEVAYDFSDADFYDKDYAASPNYAGEYQEIEVMLPGDAGIGESDAATETLSIREPID
jgi:hypothetical protein